MSATESTSEAVETLGGNAQGQLRSLIERIERLNEEKSQVLEDINEVYGEAKAFGLDVKVLRKLISLRAKDKAKLMEENAILMLYAEATGNADLV